MDELLLLLSLVLPKTLLMVLEMDGFLRFLTGASTAMVGLLLSLILFFMCDCLVVLLVWFGWFCCC